MAVMSRLLPLVAYTTFAIFLLALMATPTNALAHEQRAHVAHGHSGIAKRKRSPEKRAKRCRPQTSSLTAANTMPETSSPAPTSSAPASTLAAAPETTSQPGTTRATTKHTTKAAYSSTQSSSVAVPTSVSTGGGSSSGSTGLDPNKKLLLAWANGPTNLEKVAYGTRVGGMYTWSPWCPDNAKTLGIPCFQQLWGHKQQAAFTQQVGDNPSTLIFGFNEPNQGDQSNMSPQDAAALWNTLIRPLKQKGAKLVSPACTSAPSGKTWLQDMMKACGDDCGIDFVALHWYGTSTDAFKAYVQDFCLTFQLPVIISEYACQDFSGGPQCTKDQTDAFHRTMIEWFKKQLCVVYYAPFGFLADMGNVNPDNQLIGPDGYPNALGNHYLFD